MKTNTVKKAQVQDDQKKFWDSETVMGMIPSANGKSATRVAICAKDGTTFMDLRKFVGEGFKQHTVHGISIEMSDINAVNSIISAIQRGAAKVFVKKV